MTKSIFKKWYFWLIAFILLISLLHFLRVINIRSPISTEFFITDRENQCSNLQPPTRFEEGDNQGKYIAQYGMPSGSLYTTLDYTHPHYSDFYKTCNAHNLRSPIIW